MADLSDVTAWLGEVCAQAVYPATDVTNAGFVAAGNANSVTGGCVSIREGWPLLDELKAELNAGTVRVSIYPAPGATAEVYQVLGEPTVIKPAVHGVTAVVDGQSVSLSGAPTPGEYVTVIADGRYAYSRLSTLGTLEEILDQLLTDILADFPTASRDGDTITIPTAGRIEVRIGAPAVMAQVTHRQRHSVIIGIWAPNPEKRTQVARAIDETLKDMLTATLPDTSQCVARYEKTSVTDEYEGMSLFRRDLVYGVEYATLAHFEAFEVTSVGVTLDDSIQQTMTVW